MLPLVGLSKHYRWHKGGQLCGGNFFKEWFYLPGIIVIPGYEN